VCGGAGGLFVVYRFGGGRSPRVRGSHRAPRRLHHRAGSIPACAGEPRSKSASFRSPRVDPRVCGGAWAWHWRTAITRGRSPRVRGSRRTPAPSHRPPGSIPACAGEPRLLTRRGRCWWVDPRVCGGASFQPLASVLRPGRSPRVRGSHQGVLRQAAHAGSIPACAGEPVQRTDRIFRVKVDPRVCGGACLPCRSWGRVRGRSPRVRGSPGKATMSSAPVRSIPACAGEPCRSAARCTSSKVDPRVCGGARVARLLDNAEQGRSPRVRGSRPLSLGIGRCPGSIPACAGEPGVPGGGHTANKVDPRVCGGATQSQ